MFGSCAIEKENHDLLTLVIIRLGKKVYNGKKGDDGYDVLRFLNTIMYPHNDDFMDIVTDYIDFSQNEELNREVKRVMGLGQIWWETAMETGIKAFVLDNKEEGIPKERVIEKLQRRFGISVDEAEYYYDKYKEEEALMI